MKYGIQHQLRPVNADMAQRFHAAMLQRLHQYQAGAHHGSRNAVDIAILMMERWNEDHGRNHAEELDPAGFPKLEPTYLELQAIEVLNTVKAWADGGGDCPLPEATRMHIDVVLLMAAARRKGVR